MPNTGKPALSNTSQSTSSSLPHAEIRFGTARFTPAQAQHQASDGMQSSEISRSSSNGSVDILDRLMSHPGRQYEKMTEQLPGCLHASHRIDESDSASKTSHTVVLGEHHSVHSESAGQTMIEIGSHGSARTLEHSSDNIPENFGRASSGASRSVALSSTSGTPREHTEWKNGKGIKVKRSPAWPARDLDADERFDAGAKFPSSFSA